MLVYLAVVGDYLASPFRRIYSYVTCQNGKKTATKTVSKCSVPNCNKSATVYHEAYSIPVWLAALVLVFYITSGALTFNLIEKWTLLDSWYFCFMSLVTIGFGGFTPGRMESISMIATSAYILIGMALLSMCFNLIQTDVVMFFRNLYLWSEREDAMNLLSLTRSIPSWHQDLGGFGLDTEVSTIQNTKRGVNFRDNKLYNSLPRSFSKPDAVGENNFRRLIPERKSLDSAQEGKFYLKSEINLNDIPPLPDSVLNRTKIVNKRKNLDNRFSSTRINIEDTFIWQIASYLPTRVYLLINCWIITKKRQCDKYALCINVDYILNYYFITNHLLFLFALCIFRGFFNKICNLFSNGSFISTWCRFHS